MRNNKKLTLSGVKKSTTDAYQQYMMDRAKRKEAERSGTLKKVITDNLERAVKAHVPEWCNRVANFCLPPKWYSAIVQFVLNGIYGPRHKQVFMNRAMSGRLSMWLYFRWMVAACIYAATFKWMLWLKGKFDTFGIRTKYKTDKTGKSVIIIKHWFKEIDRIEVNP